MPIVVDAYGTHHPVRTVTVEQYIAYKTIKNKDGCIEWYGKLTPNGYPEFPKSIAQRVGFYLVYHYTYFVKTGKRVKRPMSLDHRCNNPRCINPKHLREMPIGQNVLRGTSVSAVNARKTHCPKGHPYDSHNINGDRRCKRCASEASRRYREKQRAKASSNRT